jgi:hypothetical protein
MLKGILHGFFEVYFLLIKSKVILFSQILISTKHFFTHLNKNPIPFEIRQSYLYLRFLFSLSNEIFNKLTINHLYEKLDFYS